MYQQQHKKDENGRNLHEFLSVGWYVRPTIVSNKCGWMMILYMEISTVVELRRKRRRWLNQHSLFIFWSHGPYKKRIAKKKTVCCTFRRLGEHMNKLFILKFEMQVISNIVHGPHQFLLFISTPLLFFSCG